MTQEKKSIWLGRAVYIIGAAVIWSVIDLPLLSWRAGVVAIGMVIIAEGQRLLDAAELMPLKALCAKHGINFDRANASIKHKSNNPGPADETARAS